MNNYPAVPRTKEIGVCKVMGATGPGLVRLLFGELMRLVLAGTLIALPLAYLFMNRWLDGFAYRIEISVAGISASGAVGSVCGVADRRLPVREGGSHESSAVIAV